MQPPECLSLQHCLGNVTLICLWFLLLDTFEQSIVSILRNLTGICCGLISPPPFRDYTDSYITGTIGIIYVLIPVIIMFMLMPHIFLDLLST